MAEKYIANAFQSADGRLFTMMDTNTADIETGSSLAPSQLFRKAVGEAFARANAAIIQIVKVGQEKGKLGHRIAKIFLQNYRIPAFHRTSLVMPQLILFERIIIFNQSF